jgi:hypothetical protein
VTHATAGDGLEPTMSLDRCALLTIEQEVDSEVEVISRAAEQTALTTTLVPVERC